MPDADFTEAVLAVVERIPSGSVMTYGDVGIAVGSEAPRAVGRVMALFGHATTWWRVVPASGLPPQGHARLAYPHYQAEGTPLRHVESADHYRIALSSARLPYTHEIYADVML
ncbi:MGMT family protein [Leucobacter albus]|uniref:MGMT family protein n=1 Tax=Leucobacter albus TaxID=272210 RepID=A0ABW3TLC7_9MICO